jgi:hypothetical protein
VTTIANALAREPVRVYIYTVAAAVLAALVAFGVIDATTKDILGTLVSAVLVVGGTETARSKVSPT